MQQKLHHDLDALACHDLTHDPAGVLGLAEAREERVQFIRWDRDQEPTRGLGGEQKKPHLFRKARGKEPLFASIDTRVRSR